MTVAGEGFEVVFSKLSGYIVSYIVEGTQFIKEGASLTPNFWRAPTDNDFGASLQTRFAVWKHPQISLESLNSAMEDGLAVITAEYNLPEVSGHLTLKYRINNIGEVEVTEAFKATADAKVSQMFRFGMQLPMPASFEKIIYYGRGPIENYADRMGCTPMGLYDQTVTEQFYPYIRPQENGNKTDIRWWKMVNSSGRGLMVTADEPSDLTNLLIDKVQMGLGCINSWGAVPAPEYMLPYGDYEFKYILTPIKNVL